MVGSAKAALLGSKLRHPQDAVERPDRRERLPPIAPLEGGRAACPRVTGFEFAITPFGGKAHPANRQNEPREAIPCRFYL